MAEESSVNPPFGPPDCPWEPMGSKTPVPENAFHQNGELNGDGVYVGRVKDGTSFYIGTAIPSKGVCLYLNKDSELKSSNSYEILTVACGDPLMFLDEFQDHLLFVAGSIGEDEILYPARYVEGDNTFYGWVRKENKIAYFPKDPKLGRAKFEKDYEIMVHRFLDRLCICPPRPPSPGHE